MSTRGWESVTESDAKRMGRLAPSAPKRSKYRNIKTSVEGITFDSKREADYWLLLRNREARGEITELQRQVKFALMCPNRGRSTCCLHVSIYVADFTYRDESGERHVVDAKGHKTREFALKAKWLWLQEGITVECV